MNIDDASKCVKFVGDITSGITVSKLAGAACELLLDKSSDVIFHTEVGEKLAIGSVKLMAGMAAAVCFDKKVDDFVEMAKDLKEIVEEAKLRIEKEAAKS